MKKKYKAYRASKGKPKSFIAFLFFGLLFDLFMILKGIAAFFSWPIKLVSIPLHRNLQRMGFFKWEHSHTFVCVAVGMCVLAVSFAIEHAVGNSIPARCSVETMRAAGVCPMWEAVAVLTKIGRV